METLNNRNTSNTTSHNTAQSSAIRNTGGRPRTAKGKARTKTLSTKLSVAEWKIVMKRVADSGKRPSVYLREVLLSGRVVAARTQEDRQQIRMLEGGCNNLNQLARMAHQQGVPYVRERLLSLLEGFNRLLSDMMCDIKKRANFARLVNYANNPKKARLIDSKDVRLDSNATIAASMQGQADDKPGRKLANPVYHISLNFAQEDKARLSDELMAEIARKYMRRMGIVNTQYIICRHTDTAHPHLHIVANRVDNDGNTICDSDDCRRSARICRQLTQEYGLHIANGKDNVRRDRLWGKDRVKYRIYDAVRAALATCRRWSELDKTLTKQGIQIRFRYDTAQGRIIGISFTADGCTFGGSKIDRAMSYYALDRQLNGRMLGAGEQRLSAGSEQYRQRFAELAQRGQLVAPKFGNNSITTDSRQSAATYTEGDNHILGGNNGDTVVATDAVSAGGNIIQITVASFIELAIQPYQVCISSGGGGGSNDKSGWNDKDKEKNEYRPRRRR